MKKITKQDIIKYLYKNPFPILCLGPNRLKQIDEACKKEMAGRKYPSPVKGNEVTITLTKEAMDRSMAIHKDVLKKLIENK